MSGTAATVDGASTVMHLPVDELAIGLDFRLDDDPDTLADLAASISELGVLQPLVVRRTAAGYEVVAGRRRLAAARMAGVTFVPCVERALSDDEAADVALAENLHRRDLSWIEVALAYARLRERGMQQREIAARVGKHESQVSQVLKLLTIPKELQARVHRREISYGTALDLAGRRATQGGAGGKSTKSRLTGADADIATHWRRRHDRLIAGIHQILKARDDEAGMRRLLDRLLKLDREPLPEQPDRGRAA